MRDIFQQSELKNREVGQFKNLLVDFLLLSFFAALIGGRIGYVLFYNASYFFSHPLSIIYPYDQKGNFIGLYGMSYHGAVIGILIASYFYLKFKKIDIFSWADFIVLAVPLGYFFGRLGNFLNGELYGRITNSTLGMYFRGDQGNLRHPSQLYEAFLEGVLLFLLLRFVKKYKFEKGTLLAAYFMGYGFFRIIGEQFRQPDLQVGFIFNYFTLGQLLSLVMFFLGFCMLVLNKRKKCYTESVVEK